MAPQRSQKRGTPRARVLKTAHIVLSDKAPKLACTVRNLSKSGAGLEIHSTTVGLPNEFVLLLNGARHFCRVAWRTETRMGVRFVPDPDAIAQPVGGTNSPAGNPLRPKIGRGPVTSK
jgi:hypothetical protein